MQTSDYDGQKQDGGAFVSGEWRVEPSRNLLLRGAEQVRVEPRVMDVLVQLAVRPGEVVSKEELVSAVWEGRYVSDDVLTVTVYALRKALRDDARQPRYIETVSRRGYRWIAPVHLVAADDQRLPEEPRRRGLSWRLAGGLAMIVFLAAAAGAIWMFAPSRQAQRVRSPQAHEAYAKGRYFLDQRSMLALRQAREHFERAIALDALDPAAHAGLADTFSSMSDFGLAPAADLRPRAMAAAQRALELDAESAEGHAALGRAQFLFDWDFAAAEHSLRRAIALDSDHMPAQQAMAWLQSARGRHDEAIAAAQRARQLDPVNTARYLELAWVLALAGRTDAARSEIERALQLNPRSMQIQMMKGWTEELAGQPEAAFAAYRQGLRVGGVPEKAQRRMEAAYRAGGLAGYYRGWLELMRSGGAPPVSNAWRAQIYARVGDFDSAIQSLERAYEKREGALAWVNVEPSFDALRSDARFQRIAERVGAQN
ncbi:MAG: winged helix-turn-helix domain-containing protein [Candidatus Acidiferrales bacterium]